MRTNTRAFLLFFLASAASLAQGQPSTPTPQKPKTPAAVTLPDTPAGRQLGAFLEAINSGERETIRRFVSEHAAVLPGRPLPVAELTDKNMQLFDETGGLAVSKVVKSSAHDITVIAHAKRTGASMEIQLGVEAGPPHKLRGVRLAPSEPPGDLLPGPKLTEGEIREKLDALIEKLHSEDAFSGTVLVAKDGKPFYERACGLASRAWNIPNRIDTKFNLGSMNKMFTAVAIMKLAEQGKLSFDDTVDKLLPDYPNRDLAQKVKVRQLLTHTSGLGNFFNEKFQGASRLRFRTVKDFFPLFVDDPLAFEPGTSVAYSNAGFIVLGAIIEKASGRDYFDYIRENVYKPAGMTDTDCYELDTDPSNLATGYTKRGAAPGTLRTNTFSHVVKGGPAGGGYSTVRDLLKFDVALRNQTLIGSRSTDDAWTGKVDLGPPGSQYGYGFVCTRYKGTRIVGHGGGFPGISSQLDMYLDLGYTVAVMSNYDSAAQPIALKLREWLTQGQP